MNRHCCLMMLILPLFFLWSCGGTSSDTPSLASVSGTVLLDGAPLAGAIIMFEPKESGAASTGVTDEQGHYTLIYSAEKNGAVPGVHVVSISKLTSEMGEETLPSVYNSRSTLQKTVEAGDNQIDFELESKPAAGSR